MMVELKNRIESELSRRTQIISAGVTIFFNASSNYTNPSNAWTWSAADLAVGLGFCFIKQASFCSPAYLLARLDYVRCDFARFVHIEHNVSQGFELVID